MQSLRSIGEGGSAGDGGDPAPAPVGRARLLADGTAVAPADAPAAIKGVIAAGNRIATKPYVYGGGHGTWNDNGYDCSGSVSYALHGGGLISTQLDSTGFESWGSRGHGRWITIYAQRRPRVHGRRGPALRHERREPVALAVGHALRRAATSCGTRRACSPIGGVRSRGPPPATRPAGTGVPALATRLASAACPHSPIPTP